MRANAAIVLACLAVGGVARAAPMRVAVASHDEVLVSALADAFAPSGMVVVEVDDIAPDAIAELAAVSRALAERESAGAVVWLIPDPTGATLVAYDRDVDRVLVRPLPYTPPLTPAHAAETARAARTMLRALKLPDDPVPPRPPQEIIKVIVAPPPSPPRPSPNLAAFAGFGGRYGRLGEDGVIEVQLAAAWRPDRLGVIAMASLSPEASLGAIAFTGNVTDNSFALAARMPLALSPRIGFAGLAGPAIHTVRVAGTQGAEAVSSLRFDVAFRVGATGSYAVTSRVDLGLAVTMDSLLRRQRYEVTGGQVLVMPRLQASVGVIVAVRIL